MINLFKIYLLFFMAILIVFPKNVYSQISWSQIDVLDGGTIHDIHITSNGYIFVASEYGLFRSTDDGQNWMRSEWGIYTSIVTVITGNLMDELYSCTIAGYLHRSTNLGDSWRYVLQDTILTQITALNMGENNFIYAAIGGSPDHILLSEDVGRSWQNIDSGITWSEINGGFSNNNITALISNSTGQTYMAIWGYNAGIYIYQLSQNGLEKQKKMILIH